MAEAGGEENVENIKTEKVKDQKRGKRKYLSGTTITDKNELESGNLTWSSHYDCICLNVCMYETLVRTAMEEPLL